MFTKSQGKHENWRSSSDTGGNDDVGRGVGECRRPRPARDIPGYEFEEIEAKTCDGAERTQTNKERYHPSTGASRGC